MDIKASRSGLASMISKWRTTLGPKPDVREEFGLADDHTDSDVVAGDSYWDEWGPDPLLDGFEIRAYQMVSRAHLPEEGPGHLLATLIRQHPPRHERAVLYIHGWNEYFFQRHVADFFEQLGYDFYAVDLHRYGRSLQEGELFGYMEDIEDYYEELDACVDLIRQDHSKLVIYGHSTGGLLSALFACDRPKTFVGVLLNAPWIDMQGSALFRAMTAPIVRGLAVASPTMVLPTVENDVYGRSLHTLYHGEWDYDLGLKRVDSQPLRPGWVRAVVNGHDRVGAGLRIDCPVLVVTSARSSDAREWTEEAMSTDMALDVDRIASRVHLLGWHVTLVRLQGALHDVSLSREDVRERYFDEIRRWDLAYLRGPRTQEKASQDGETA
ncbi:MAG: alpha/beta hydrolase [Propionibacteriaceae bacterium]|nr:alpha/beta hydrolase [Propionibacteriaceae bacterium]